MGKQNDPKKQLFLGKNVLICGGSKGIGKETAKEIVRLGGSVTIVARDERVLKAAQEEIGTLIIEDSQYIDTIACDTTNFDKLKPLLDSYVSKRGTPDYLLNVVGYAYPQYVQELALDDFKKNMDVNYYGQLVPTLILLPHFIEKKNDHISFVSSVLGFMGIMGYATYAPSKYAIAGLAEVLRHELKPHNIQISVLYPPDTETPGFEIENQTKPPETAMLSETAKLFSPEQVAKVYVKGILKNKFSIVAGDAGMIWRLFRFAPKIVRMIIDNDFTKARKKLGKP